MAGDVEVLGKVQLLMDQHDAVPFGVLDAGEADRLAVEAELAGVRRVDAGEDLHQRRFAGPVLADDGEHLAAAARAG